MAGRWKRVWWWWVFPYGGAVVVLGGLAGYVAGFVWLMDHRPDAWYTKAAIVPLLLGMLAGHESGKRRKGGRGR